MLDVAAGARRARGRARLRAAGGRRSLDFVIEGGRHPVVEQALRRRQPFVANDCDLVAARQATKAGRIWLLTGPNMAGKSTFLRQNALIAVLAQMGSFVPAQARA